MARPRTGVPEGAGSAGHLVEEAEDGDDLAVFVGDRDVEADHQRLSPFWPQAPGKARLPVVRVNGGRRG